MLEETELRAEQLIQLKETDRSPGYRLLLARLRLRLEYKEKDKADSLLKNKLHEAVVLQGYINALKDVDAVMSQYVAELELKVDESEPVY